MTFSYNLNLWHHFVHGFLLLITLPLCLIGWTYWGCLKLEGSGQQIFSAGFVNIFIFLSRCAGFHKHQLLFSLCKDISKSNLYFSNTLYLNYKHHVYISIWNSQRSVFTLKGEIVSFKGNVTKLFVRFLR